MSALLTCHKHDRAADLYPEQYRDRCWRLTALVMLVTLGAGHAAVGLSMGARNTWSGVNVGAVASNIGHEPSAVTSMGILGAVIA